MTALVILILYIPIIVITAITPYITRKTESFGVTIPEAVYNNEEVKQFRKSYVKKTGIVGFTLLSVSLIGGIINDATSAMTIFLLAIILYLLTSFLIYLEFHKKMKKLKENSSWGKGKNDTVIIDTNFRKEKLTLSNAWFIFALLITVATFAITVIFYDKIPNEFPMQYDFEGNVTNIVEKSYASVFGLPLTQLFMLVMFIFLNSMIGRSRQQIDAANPEKSIQQNIIFRRRWSAFMVFSGTALVLLFALIQLSLILSMDYKIIAISSLVVSAVIVIAAIIISIVTGQGGSRVKTVTGKDGEIINRDEDKYWKLGIFYMNASDPSVWVEKRFGSGWTINFARPIAWVFIVIVILIPILISIFTTMGS
ncbi:DUF1648 domain-containing protein [Lederbergia graminis]|uniref:DUF1648 domain-containing protein n=1 Tax=Lederbergia graminis TaxID=735518 RepID=A0ABW0LLQ6_9BACI